jgi:hypothetical protein
MIKELLNVVEGTGHDLILSEQGKAPIKGTNYDDVLAYMHSMIDNPIDVSEETQKII